MAVTDREQRFALLGSQVAPIPDGPVVVLCRVGPSQNALFGAKAVGRQQSSRASFSVVSLNSYGVACCLLGQVRQGLDRAAVVWLLVGAMTRRPGA
jgi:hypothetical protein